MEPAEAIRSLRSYSSGHVVIDETLLAVRYVLDRRRGSVVFQIPLETAEGDEAHLVAPDESDPAIAALLKLETTSTPPGDIELRYEIYHGAAREPRWAIGSVEALRYHGEVFHGDEIELRDQIIEHEPGLCRSLNARPDAIRAACADLAGAKVDRPVVVGVDPDGLDVRARFGIVRIEFDEPAPTLEAVRARLDRLTEESPA